MMTSTTDQWSARAATIRAVLPDYLQQTHRHCQIYIYTDRQTDRQTDRHIDREGERWTDIGERHACERTRPATTRL